MACIVAASVVIALSAWVFTILSDRRAYIRQNVKSDAVNYFSDTYDEKWLDEQTDKYMEKGLWWLLTHDVRSLDRDKSMNKL
jgi:type III secretory pathway component EscR